MQKIIVVGAGASGMMAAITAASVGAAVTVLEGMPKPGKKLLLTGNGRCNLTSLDPDLPDKYHSCSAEDASAFSKDSLSCFSVPGTLAFFRRIGLPCTARDTYVYPQSGQAQSVLQVLLREMDRLGIKLKYQTRVQKILYDSKKKLWNVDVGGWTYTCDRIILCCGSKAAPITGSDGSGYTLAEQAGHTVCPVTPGLTALMIDDRKLQQAAGARSAGALAVRINGRVYRSRGEIQWNKDNISGIAVFQLSAVIGRELMKKSSVPLQIDLLPDWKTEDLCMYLEELGIRGSGKIRFEDLLCGLLPERVIRYCRERCPEMTGTVRNREQMRQLAEKLKNMTMHVTGLRGYEQAQTCCGGVSLHEVDPRTLESKIQKGLYFAGEILDLDGPCGGYNLQWAWSSGYTAGKNAAADPE